jgi:hypothetical protein
MRVRDACGSSVAVITFRARFLVAEVDKIGYQSLGYEYPESYRNNTRTLVLSPALSSSLWRRIVYFFGLPALPSDEINLS